jgi:hypothetical protein
MEELNNVKESDSATKTEQDDVARTVEYWRKSFIRGIDKHIFGMVVYEQGLEERDRLTKSQLDSLMSKRKNKKIG